MPKILVFKTEISSFLNAKQLIDDPILCHALGIDASLYQMTPKLVVKAKNLEEIQKIILAANKHQVTITFRAAGTSLSGQAVTDSVLVVLTPGTWQQYQIHNKGEYITLQPGIIGSYANRLLAPYQRKIGPDPASIDSCKIGGIAANNASGMCCGVTGNSYHTLKDIKLVLANGSVLDTKSATSVQAFKQDNQALLSHLSKLAIQTKENKRLANLIQRKYQIKNTTGYTLNALIDYSDPIEILSHLMIGSEGTLGFIAEITYKTLPKYSYRATSLLFFKDIYKATEAILSLKKTSVVTAELMDSKSLIAAEKADQMPLKSFDPSHKHQVVLLIEVTAADQSQLQSQQQEVDNLIQYEQLIDAIRFTQDEELIAQIWKMRKSALPIIGAVRPVGTAVVIEDVAVPLDKLSQLVSELQNIFRDYQYHEAVIFGHALEGNLHFVFTPRFDEEKEVRRYRRLMEAVAHLVSDKLLGSLKAEHGTGRNMASFVKKEWGESAYQLMHDIKNLLDPKGILNPDVILSDDPEIYLKHFKITPQADSIIDPCMECGFCEPACPTRNNSLTPRQRIALIRQTQTGNTLNKDDQEKIQKILQSEAIDSCVTTGLCAQKCPVSIDTGAWVKAQRSQNISVISKIIPYSFVNQSWAWKGALSLSASIESLTKGKLSTLTKSLHQKSQRLPVYLQHTPRSSHQIEITNGDTNKSTQHKVVYFPSCISKIMGKDPQVSNSRQTSDAMLSLMRKAGFEVILADKAKQCCGQSFISSGDFNQANRYQQQLQDYLYELSEQGKWPVVTDMSSCSHQLHKSTKPTILDSTEFIAQHILPNIQIQTKHQKIALHITCSSRLLNHEKILKEICQQIAHEVIIPNDVSCCGFAGNKGFSQPETNQSALKALGDQVKECTLGVTTNRTCQIGLNEYSSIPYYALAEILDNGSV